MIGKIAPFGLTSPNPYAPPSFGGQPFTWAGEPTPPAPARTPATPATAGTGGSGGMLRDMTRDQIMRETLRRGFAPATASNLVNAAQNAMGIARMTSPTGMAGILGREALGLGQITGNTNQLTPSARAALAAAMARSVPTSGPVSRMATAARSFDHRGALRDFERDTRMAANTGGLSGAHKRDAHYGEGTERGGSQGSRSTNSGAGGAAGGGGRRSPGREK